MFSEKPISAAGRVELDAQLRQSVIDHEQLHQQRRAAEERNIDPRQPLQRPERVQPQQRQTEAQQQAEEHPTQAQHHGPPRALEQEGQGVQDQLQAALDHCVTSAPNHFSDSSLSVPSARSLAMASLMAASSCGLPLRRATPDSWREKLHRPPPGDCRFSRPSRRRPVGRLGSRRCGRRRVLELGRVIVIGADIGLRHVLLQPLLVVGAQANPDLLAGEVGRTLDAVRIGLAGEGLDARDGGAWRSRTSACAPRRWSPG